MLSTHNLVQRGQVIQIGKGPSAGSGALPVLPIKGTRCSSGSITVIRVGPSRCHIIYSATVTTMHPVGGREIGWDPG